MATTTASDAKRRRLRVAIVGYGSGGQAAALLLSRDGHEVEVFERVAEPGPVGAGLLLQPTGLSVLWEMGLLESALTHGARVTRLYGENERGRVVMDMRYAELDACLFAVGIQRGTLFLLMDAAWREARCIHAASEVTDIDTAAGSVTLADGHRQHGFDLIVVADGSASALRAKVAPAGLNRPYPWGAQWCLVDADAWPWMDELRQRYVAARRMVGMLPVGHRPDDAVKRLSFFWSLPVDQLKHGIDDPQRWRDDVAAVWPEAAERLAAIDVPAGLAVARYRDTTHRRWSNGCAVLLGDAAHAMSPQLGQGVNMALLDALALRDALRAHSGIASALHEYQRQRRRHVNVYHACSRWLTPLFQSEYDLAARWRDRLFHPLSRLPGSRAQSLRILTGTKRGWLGRQPLPKSFLEALTAHRVDGKSPTD